MNTIKPLLTFAGIAAFTVAGMTTAGEMKHDHGEAKMDMAEHQVGDLMLKAPFARATLPNQPVAGAFLTISNVGNEDDVLVAVLVAYHREERTDACTLFVGRFAFAPCDGDVGCA